MNDTPTPSTDLEAKLRIELRGHPDSELWGDAGLIAATMRCVDALDEVTEQRDMLAVNNNRVIELLKDGLQTDGSHQKQWYLNEVLKLINADIAKDVEMHWTHDGGIAP